MICERKKPESLIVHQTDTDFRIVSDWGRLTGKKGDYIVETGTGVLVRYTPKEFHEIFEVTEDSAAPELKKAIDRGRY